MGGTIGHDAELLASSARVLGTAVRVLKVLDLVAHDPRGVSAKVIAHRLGISLSSAYSLINSLRAEGFVEVSPVGSGLFTLSEKVVKLYSSYVEASIQPERFEPFLEELRDRARTRAYVALWKDGDLEVAQIAGRRGTRGLHDVSAGFRGAAHALALGKPYLARLDEQQWPSYLQRPIFKRFSPKTIVSRQALRSHLLTVQQRGIAFDIEEYEVGNCCIAAPVQDAAGRAVTTLGVSVSVQRFSCERDALINAVTAVSRAAAAELASRQGMVSPPPQRAPQPLGTAAPLAAPGPRHPRPAGLSTRP